MLHPMNHRLSNEGRMNNLAKYEICTKRKCVPNAITIVF